MGMFTNEQEVNQFRNQMGTNMDFINNPSFMIMRIDTSPLLRKIRKDIGGKETVLIEDSEIRGGYREEERQVARALANDEGLMHIGNMVEEIVNQHTVQGNLKEDHYWTFLPNTREEISMAIVMNCYDWGIDDKYLNYIIDKVMRIVELFLTRPMDNKERESYQKEFQSREVIQTNPSQKSGISGFGSGIGAK